MTKEEAKEGVRKIFYNLLQHDPVYWLEDTYIRWGKVEKDINRIIEDVE